MVFSSFSVSNGDCQGGILSSKLFNVYIYYLSEKNDVTQAVYGQPGHF